MPNYKTRENYGLIIATGSSEKDSEKKVFTKDINNISKFLQNNKISPILVVNPSLNNFKTFINVIKCHATDDHVTYFYFSCHGYEYGLKMLSENGELKSMSYRELKGYLDTIKGKKVLIIDSCHSGACITDIEDTTIVNSQFFNTSTNVGYAYNIPNAFRDKDYFVIAACAANQLTKFNSDGSHFTNKMCKSVDGCSTKPYATLKEIFEYVRNNGINAVCYPEESDYPIFGDSIIHANSTYYLVEAKVANVNGAGTDANIYIRFIGDKGSSGKYLLDHKNIDDFERNRVYKYIVQCNADVGNLKKIEISSDNTEKEPDLLLQYVKVTDTGKELFYKTGSLSSYWITKQHPSRIFSLSRINYHTYDVTITIGKEDGAGTDAGVRIQFYGTNGISGYYLLDSPIDDFERASFNTYRVKIDTNIGTLQYIKIDSDGKGKSPDFHITNVVIKDTATQRCYSSSKSAYFNSKCRNHTFILQPDSCTEYFVDIQVADEKDAGTNANIYIKLEGTNNKSDYILLDTPEKDDFERNTYNLFRIYGINLGTLKKVYIKNGNEGKGPGMKVQYIDVTDKSINKKYRAKCDYWIEKATVLEKSFDLVAQ
ncbi:PLAT/LH2 domain-containing protein [Ruminococcus flavefaciens]|uniref:Caspase domain-containing protein n=1 Tax=Ruminococcus flavefaciens TaxID=1265 RepID=A0A1M7G4U8_RUMFL|nr:PLAT/LH2 domain-containing protein [Ruminococcus flavefaciens]SHM11303.1 Caspase domain-containing protein [Ruminococcus flavefaciens]